MASTRRLLAETRDAESRRSRKIIGKTIPANNLVAKAKGIASPYFGMGSFTPAYAIA